MNKRNRIIIILLFLFLLCPNNINASSGRLTGGSIKTCPNGVTYGSHAGHYHKAVKKNGYYYASGRAIKNDPCPPKSDNNDLKSLKVDGEDIQIYYEMEYETYNNSIKIVAKPYDSKAKVTNNYKKLKVGSNTIKITVTAENGSKQNYILNVDRLEMDTSIKTLSIDEDNISVSDKMEYETYNKDIKLNILPNDDSVKVSTDYKSLNVGENIIKIVLTASNGDKSTYYLNVILKEEEKADEEIVEDNIIESNENTEIIEEETTQELVDENIDEEVITDEEIKEDVIVEPAKEETIVEEKKVKSEPQEDESDSSDIVIPLILAVPAGIVIKKIKKK